MPDWRLMVPDAGAADGANRCAVAERQAACSSGAAPKTWRVGPSVLHAWAHHGADVLALRLLAGGHRHLLEAQLLAGDVGGGQREVAWQKVQQGMGRFGHVWTGGWALLAGGSQQPQHSGMHAL